MSNLETHRNLDDEEDDHDEDDCPTCRRGSSISRRDTSECDHKSEFEEMTDFEHVDLTEPEIREILTGYVSKSCCFSTKPLKRLSFCSYKTIMTYKYVLQTHTESRSTSWACEPYNPYVDSADNYPDKYVDIWSVEAKPRKSFNHETVRLELPDTSYIDKCSTCSGLGSHLCEACQGTNKKPCSICKGTGYSTLGTAEAVAYENKLHYDDYDKNPSSHNHLHYHQQNMRHTSLHSYYNYRSNYYENGIHPLDMVYCVNCDGKGQIECYECDAGQIYCNACNSTGKLKFYTELKVTYDLHSDEQFVNLTELPDDLLRACPSFKLIFSNESSHLKPIKDKNYFQLNQISRHLIKFHLCKYGHNKIIAQRHFVYITPVTVCSYYYKNKLNTFFIYGFDQKVYHPSYPRKIDCRVL